MDWYFRYSIANMKKRFIILSILITVTIGIYLFSFFSQTNSPEVFVPLRPEPGENRSSEDQEIITARGDWGYPPFEYLNDEGKPEGFNIDILTGIAELLNLNIHINLGPWDEVRKDIEEGNIDIVTGMYRTEERDKEVDFSIPHFRSSIGVFVPEGSSIRRIEDIKEAHILVQEGDVAHDYLLEHGLGSTISTVTEWEDLLPQLIKGEADCVVMGMVQGAQLLRKRRYTQLHVLSEPLLQRPYSIAVQEGDAELLATINEGLNLLKSSGRYDEIYQKWFGIYYSDRLIERPMVRILILGSLILAFVLFLSILWTYSLRKQVGRQTAALQTALQKLKLANEYKNRFLASVSHELRTPLHGMIGMQQLLEQSGLDEQQRELLLRMQIASNQLLRVISDLIDSSKIETGELSLQKSAFALRELRDWMYPILLKSAEDRGLRFSFKIEGENTRIVSDKERISQVILNLSDNALKNTSRGSVSVQLKYDADSETLEICIRDTGRGISESKQQEIFKPFTQLETEEGRKTGGLGLGLSIVHTIVDMLEGRIELTSTPGEGSLFSVSIPAPRQQAQEEKGTERALDGESGEPQAAEKAVLVVEDEAINRLYLDRLFTGRNWRVTGVGSGEAAYKVFCDSAFSFVLMDLSIPSMDGLETTRKIRRFETEHGKKRTPIIAMTGHAQESNRDECYAAGMDGFVTKPFLEHTLLREIERILGHP